MISMKTIIMTSLLLANSSVFALQALDDQVLAQTTAQDGLTITLHDFSATARIIWIDTNGINSADGINPTEYGLTGTPQVGSVVFGDGTQAGNFRTSVGTTVFTIDADGGSNASGSEAMLNVNIDLPANLSFQTGNVYVAGKDNNNLINQTKIMKDMKFELGGLKMNLQMGNAPQGAFLLIGGQAPDGLRISNIGIIGARSGSDEYGIGIGQMLLRDSGETTKFSFDGTSVKITNQGLLFRPISGRNIDVLMSDVKLGNLSASSAAIGNMALLDLNLGNISILVSGH